MTANRRINLDSFVSDVFDLVNGWEDFYYTHDKTPKAYHIYNDGDLNVIEIDMPGVNKEDIKLDVVDRILVVSSKTEPDKSKKRDYEFKFRLPNYVDLTDNKASLENGVLKIVFGVDKQRSTKISID